MSRRPGMVNICLRVRIRMVHTAQIHLSVYVYRGGRLEAGGS